MKNPFLPLLLAILFFTNMAISQTSNDGWLLRDDFHGDIGGKMFYKQDGIIKFTFYSDVNMSDREFIMKMTKKYIEECLAIIKENNFSDSVDVIIVRNRDDMTKFVSEPNSGEYIRIRGDFKQKTIVCIGGSRNPLKHEIMHLISDSKWGSPKGYYSMEWLVEGLATYANPEAECDTLSFEEKYTFLLQSKRIICADTLINSFDIQHNKTYYCQSAYIVKYLIDNHGIEKIKELWINGMCDFEKIYNSNLNGIMNSIEIKLKKKYPNPITFDWAEFEKKCY